MVPGHEGAMSNPRLFRRALAEFTAITVGVLVALAIDSAWTARGDRVLEQDYLGRVIEEVEGNARRVGGTVNGADWARDNLDRANRIAELGLPEDSATVFVASLARATSFMATPSISGAVVQDLVSTGNLRLIRDGEVRQAILSMDADVKGRVRITFQAEAEVASGLEPLISGFIPPHVVSREDQNYAITVAESSDARAALIRAANHIVGDPMFRRALNAEYRRLQRGRETSVRLKSMLDGYAERLASMVQGGTT